MPTLIDYVSALLLLCRDLQDVLSEVLRLERALTNSGGVCFYHANGLCDVLWRQCQATDDAGDGGVGRGNIL